MTGPIIAVTDSPFPSLDPVEAALAKLDPELRMAKSSSAEDIIAVAHDADAVIVCYAQITAAVIAGLNRCKVIGRTGLGVDNIDVPAAAARGIR
jgi:D-3-phosphoglycerate dehydrogenase